MNIMFNGKEHKQFFYAALHYFWQAIQLRYPEYC